MATFRQRRRMLADEREQIRVYHDLAARRSGEEREILLELAEAEKRHAAHWENALGEDVGVPRRGSLRMRVLAFLARRLGWVFVLALVQRAETFSRHDFDDDLSRLIAAEDRIHAEVVKGLAARGRARLSGTLRAAVFGINDGLVSNIALVLGVIGGGADTRDTVLLTGLAGLLAGALSMAAGEYISVSSQRELLAASTPDESSTPSVPGLDIDFHELALVYRARGVPRAAAEERARAVLRRTPGERVPGTSAPAGDEVVGSAMHAAASSFVFFGVGALLPVLPFLFGAVGLYGVVLASCFTGAALLVTGAVVGILSGTRPLSRALRQFTIGAGAAGATYLLGVAFSATVG